MVSQWARPRLPEFPWGARGCCRAEERPAATPETGEVGVTSVASRHRAPRGRTQVALLALPGACLAGEGSGRPGISELGGTV